MTSSVSSVSHTQPVLAANKKPPEPKPKPATQTQDSVHLSSTAEAHLSAIKTQEAKHNAVG
jgi:hypothetical protein